VVVKSKEQFVGYIEEQFKKDGSYPSFISFDYHLAPVSMQVTEDRFIYYGDETYTPDGVECAEWILEFCQTNNLPIPKYFVHDVNPTGRRLINKVFNSVGATVGSPITTPNTIRVPDPFMEVVKPIEPKINVIKPVVKTEPIEKIETVLQPAIDFVTKQTNSSSLNVTITDGDKSTKKEKVPVSQLQQEYWEAFKNFLEEKKSTVRVKKALPQYWTNIPMGRSDFYISAMINTRGNILSVVLCFMGSDSKSNYDKLYELAYEGSLEIKDVVWDKKEGSKMSEVYLKTNGDFLNTNDWSKQFEWFMTTLEQFTAYFKPIIKNKL
jgi:hypothetical protein